MIFICFLVLIGALNSYLAQPLDLDVFTAEVFSRYNENAETFQTGVLVRLDDGSFSFGHADDPLGLSCTEGYMRPVVLNVIRSEFDQTSNTYETQVVIKNATLFYKDCRVTRESKMFTSGTPRTPCFLGIEVSSLICWTNINSQKLDKDNCQNSIEVDIHDDITGVGTVKLFFLRSSTLYTFSLNLDVSWTQKIRETISITSRLILYDYTVCTNPSPVNKFAPKDVPKFNMSNQEGVELDDQRNAKWNLNPSIKLGLSETKAKPTGRITRISKLRLPTGATGNKTSAGFPAGATANKTSTASPAGTPASMTSAGSPAGTSANMTSTGSPVTTVANTTSAGSPATTTANMTSTGSTGTSTANVLLLYGMKETTAKPTARITSISKLRLPTGATGTKTYAGFPAGATANKTSTASPVGTTANMTSVASPAGTPASMTSAGSPAGTSANNTSVGSPATTVASMTSAGSPATTTANTTSTGSPATATANVSSAGSPATTVANRTSAGPPATTQANVSSAGSPATTAANMASAGSSATATVNMAYADAPPGPPSQEAIAYPNATEIDSISTTTETSLE